MKNWLIVLIFIFGGVTYGQTTYTSPLTEYLSAPDTPSEWMQRTITIGDSIITIDSKGKQARDIQKWNIQEVVIDGNDKVYKCTSTDNQSRPMECKCCLILPLITSSQVS